jgi:endonuclease YncB( thermonuclease family)
VLDLDLGFFVRIEETVRLARINTPETVNWSAKGIDDPAKNFILQLLPPGAVCVARITRKEKYGRWLADILFRPGVADRAEILQNPRVLNDELVREGFALPYDGGRK